MVVVSAPSAAQAAIPRYAAVLSDAEFRTELERLAGGEWGWGTPREVHLRPLKWHRVRCTFEIRVRTERGWHAIIGKVFATAQPLALPAMQAIREAGFAGDAEFSIPQPLAYFPSLHVLLEEKIEGPSARDLLLGRRPAEGCLAARRCGEWLARFQAAAPQQGPAADLRAELRHCGRWIDTITTFGEPLAGASKRLLERLESAPPDDVPPSASHGSYIPEHVLLSGGRTVTIDLDECSVADPGCDVAWFLVSLQRLALAELGSLQALDTIAGQFLGAYEAAGGRAAAGHVAYYRAVQCLHRARRDVVKRVPPVPQWALLMLAEGMRVVSGQNSKDA